VASVGTARRLTSDVDDAGRRTPAAAHRPPYVEPDGWHLTEKIQRAEHRTVALTGQKHAETIALYRAQIVGPWHAPPRIGFRHDPAR